MRVIAGRDIERVDEVLSEACLALDLIQSVPVRQTPRVLGRLAKLGRPELSDGIVALLNAEAEFLAACEAHGVQTPAFRQATIPDPALLVYRERPPGTAGTVGSAVSAASAAVSAGPAAEAGDDAAVAVPEVRAADQEIVRAVRHLQNMVIDEPDLVSHVALLRQGGKSSARSFSAVLRAVRELMDVRMKEGEDSMAMQRRVVGTLHDRLAKTHKRLDIDTMELHRQRRERKAEMNALEVQLQRLEYERNRLETLRDSQTTALQTDRDQTIDREATRHSGVAAAAEERTGASSAALAEARAAGRSAERLAVRRKKRGTLDIQQSIAHYDDEIVLLQRELDALKRRVVKQHELMDALRGHLSEMSKLERMTAEDASAWDAEKERSAQLQELPRRIAARMVQRAWRKHQSYLKELARLAARKRNKK